MTTKMFNISLFQGQQNSLIHIVANPKSRNSSTNQNDFILPGHIQQDEFSSSMSALVGSMVDNNRKKTLSLGIVFMKKREKSSSEVAIDETKGDLSKMIPFKYDERG
jgi:hypothetical protein